MGSKSRRRSQQRRRDHATAVEPPISDTPGDEPPKEQTEGQKPSLLEQHRNQLDSDLQSDELEQLLPQADTATETPVKSPCDGDVAQEAETDPLPLEEATKVLEKFFVAMLAANISPVALLNRLASRNVTIEDLESHFFSQSHGEVELHLLQQRALRAFGDPESKTIQVDSIEDLASAPTFRVEMLEFQVRQAVLDRAGGRSRGKVDVQRFLAKVASTIPEETATVAPRVLQFILEEKLGVSSGNSLLLKIVFGRITGHIFTHTLPESMEIPKATFFAHFETFVQDRSLSLDSVGGKLRQLLNKHPDLRASFQAIDTDKSGSITLDEFVSFLQREADMEYPREVLAAFIHRFDTDGDGMLSYEEFVEFVSPKVFGIRVLTPFGMFYLAAERHDKMEDVVAKIKRRMFWMQHNDLFTTRHQPNLKAPIKLKVTDNFILTHFYGSIRLLYKNDDPIAKVLNNGEMVVVILDPRPTKCSESLEDDKLPPFEYRLKPKVKRTIPPLTFWTLRQQEEQRAASSATSVATDKTTSCRQSANSRRPSTSMGATTLREETASTKSFTTPTSTRRERRNSTAQPIRHESSRIDHSVGLRGTPSVSLRQNPVKLDTERGRPKKVLTKTQSSVSSGFVESSSLKTDVSADMDRINAGMCQKNMEEGGAEGDEDVFEYFVDDGVRDECSAQSPGVEDASVGCDEDETPPPPYYA